MPAKLQDIAKQTKTSVSTVSRVLAGGSAAQRISTPTRKLVLAAAKKMGYRPNLIARGLRTRKSNTIALLVSDIGAAWFGQIASRIEQLLHRHGYSTMLCNSGEDAQREEEYLTLLPQKGIDGLIVVPLAHSRQKLMEHLPKNLPLVVLDRPVPGISASVASDPEQMVGELCDVLERIDVKEVALVAGPHDVTTHGRRAEIVSERFRIIARHEGPPTIETGRAAFIKFLSLAPQAIVCTNCLLAEGVIDAIEQVDAPPVIACVDDLPMMHLLPLPIVAAAQDIPMLAESAVNLLLPQLDGKHEKLKPILLPARIVTNRAFQKRFEQDIPV